MKNKHQAENDTDTQIRIGQGSQEVPAVLSELAEKLAEKHAIAISAFAEKVAQQLYDKFSPLISELAKSYRKWVDENSQTFKVIAEKILEYAKQAKEWQESQKVSVIYMAENGWFPNWYTFYYKPETEYTDLDAFMLEHIKQSSNKIMSEILNKCPNRSHILEVAFNLHKSGNYIASIPLLLSQADGIFCEEMKSFLFAGEKPKEAIDKLIESGEIQTGFFQDILLEPYKIKSQFSEGMSKASKVAKSKAPNRHGIMHGYRKHLDYGTEINSAKCLSLLAFVVFSVKDTFKKTNTRGA